MKPHIFAFVQWYQKHPLHQSIPKPVEVWCAQIFESFGPASFLLFSEFIPSLLQLLANSMMKRFSLYVPSNRKFSFEILFVNALYMCAYKIVSIAGQKFILNLVHLCFPCKPWTPIFTHRFTSSSISVLTFASYMR